MTPADLLVGFSLAAGIGCLVAGAVAEYRNRR